MADRTDGEIWTEVNGSSGRQQHVSPLEEIESILCQCHPSSSSSKLSASGFSSLSSLPSSSLSSLVEYLRPHCPLSDLSHFVRLVSQWVSCRSHELKEEMGNAHKKRKGTSSSTSRSDRAGLTFPVGAVTRQLKARTRSQDAVRVAGGAPIYVAAVLQYITTEILDMAAQNVKAKRAKRAAKAADGEEEQEELTILPTDLVEAVNEDDEMKAVMRDIVEAKQREKRERKEKEKENALPVAPTSAEREGTDKDS